MTDLRMPQLNANDTTYTLIEWLVDDGAHVRRGDPVAVVETSKATEELVAEDDGYLRRIATERGEFGVGELIGRQFRSEAERDEYTVPSRDAPEAAAAFVLTDAARALVAAHDIAPAALAGLHRKVIRSVDVEALIGAHGTVSAAERQQQAVAAVVTASHRDIPAAFTLMRVYVDAALTLIDRLRTQEQLVVGIPELLVKALGSADAGFPQFYAGGHGGRADVGVTIDLGTGLFIPVVREPGEATLAQIAATMMEFRKKAFRRSFRAQDLAGAGSIVLSLSHEPDVVLAQTVIFPQHAAMVSVGGVIEELHLDDAGTVARRRYVNLGLTFDHRVANGRDAVLFLRRLKDLIESAAS